MIEFNLLKTGKMKEVQNSLKFRLHQIKLSACALDIFYRTITKAFFLYQLLHNPPLIQPNIRSSLSLVSVEYFIPVIRTYQSLT